MIQNYFFLILMLVACVVSSNGQTDSIISDLKKKNEMLQDSVAYLLKQSAKMQQQLKNLASSSTHNSNEKRISEIEKMITSSTQMISRLLQWKNKVDEEKQNTAMNPALLDQHLKPVNSEIKKLKDGLDKVSREEHAIEMTVEKQITQMGYLFQEVEEVKNNLPPIKNGMQYLRRNIDFSSARMEQTEATLKEFEEFKNKTEQENKKISKKIGVLNHSITSIVEALGKLKKS